MRLHCTSPRSFGAWNIHGGDGEGTRVFDVFCNGVALLRELDVQKEGGGSRPLVRTLKLIFSRSDAFSPKIHFG